MKVIMSDKSTVGINEYDEQFVLVDNGDGLELVEVSKLQSK